MEMDGTRLLQHLSSFIISKQWRVDKVEVIIPV
jgi:hypothetical protein